MQHQFYYNIHITTYMQQYIYNTLYNNTSTTTSVQQHTYNIHTYNNIYTVPCIQLNMHNNIHTTSIH